MSTNRENETRRDFIKKAAYVVPAVLSVNVALVEARAGSPPPMEKGAPGQAPMREGRNYEREQRRTDRDK